MGSWAWMPSVSSTGFWGAGAGWMAPGSHSGWNMCMTELRRTGMLVVLHDTPKSPLMPSGESLSSALLSPHPAGILRCSPLDIPFRGPRVMVWAKDLLLFQRTWLCLPGPMSGGLELPVTADPGEPMFYSVSMAIYTYVAHVHTRVHVRAHKFTCAHTDLFLSFICTDLRSKLFLSHSFKFKGLILPFNKWIMAKKCCLFHSK